MTMQCLGLKNLSEKKMKIKILGTRGEIKESLPGYSKHSGVLVDDKILLDLGEKEFLRYKPKWIFITHLHPDHAYFVRWGKEEIPPATTPIYAPEAPENALIHKSVHVLEDALELGAYTIVPIPTHHSKRVKSQAYLIKKGKQSLLYTGDLVWMDKKYHDLLGDVTLVITDGSFIRKGGMIRKDPETQALYGHNGIPNLIDLFKNHTKNILFVHFGGWFYKDIKASREMIQKLGTEKGVNVLAGYEGMDVNLSEPSTSC